MYILFFHHENVLLSSSRKGKMVCNFSKGVGAFHGEHGLRREIKFLPNVLCFSCWPCNIYKSANTPEDIIPQINHISGGNYAVRSALHFNKHWSRCS